MLNRRTAAPLQLDEHGPTGSTNFGLLAERARDIVYRIRLSPRPTLEYINDAATQLTGYTPDELYEDPALWKRLVHRDDELPATRDRGGPAQLDEPALVRWIRKDGSTLWIEHRSVRVLDGNGSLVAVEGVAHDVSRRVQAEQRLNASESERLLLAAAMEQTADAVVATDPAGRIIFVNSAFLRSSGKRRQDLIGRDSPFPNADSQDAAAFEATRETLRRGQAWHGELDSRRADGSEYTQDVTIAPVFDAAGALSAYISVQRDVSHIREVEAELVLEAAIRALLGQAIEAAATSSSLEEAADAVCEGLASLPGIHFVNLLAFLGPAEAVVIACGTPDGVELRPGDRLPEKHARYLQERVASGPWGERRGPDHPDEDIVNAMGPAGIQAFAVGPIGQPGRIGGVLIVGTRDRRFAKVVAEKMPPLVAFGATANTLLVDRLDARRQENHLRGVFDVVLASGAFHPVFQPIVELASGDTIGYEALTRFDSGAPPDACFADAWSVNLGAELELATLGAAVAVARALPAGRWLDINVSPRFLEAHTGLATLLGTADRPIVVEVTEHERIGDYAVIRAAAAALGHGVRIAVDDAGVGIANFGHIVELRPDFVKLDMSLVRRVNVDPGRQALVVAMRHFARTAGCRLVAEGIETGEEARTLRQLGVEFGQGYWFGRPEPVGQWLEEGASIPDA
jgi:PAS domain S-box-containing protein